MSDDRGRGAGASDNVDENDAEKAQNIDGPEAFATINSVHTNDRDGANMGTIDYAVSKKDAGANATKDNDGKIKKNQNE
jgi:hypothetical protein